MTSDSIEINPAVAIPGVRFRHFRGSIDYPSMAAAIALSADADQVNQVATAEDIAIAYTHLSNSDPYHDMIVAEANHAIIGYSRGWWYKEENGPHLYAFVGFLVPAWRRKGIGRQLLHWMENRLRAIAADHPGEQEKFFQAFVTEYEVGLAAMLARAGYQPVRYEWEMVRPTLNNLPDFPMPAGLEIRPVLPEHYQAIWDADTEAFRDHWGFSEPTDAEYQDWLADKRIFQPELWQVAWDVATNQIAGQVRPFIHHAQNDKYKRKRSFTESISVRRPWRRRGLARALIVRSLDAQKQQGMTESALSVDSENRSGATRIYEECGFRVTKQNTIYRKQL